MRVVDVSLHKDTCSQQSRIIIHNINILDKYGFIPLPSQYFCVSIRHTKQTYEFDYTAKKATKWNFFVDKKSHKKLPIFTITAMFIVSIYCLYSSEIFFCYFVGIRSVFWTSISCLSSYMCNKAFMIITEAQTSIEVLMKSSFFNEFPKFY